MAIRLATADDLEQVKSILAPTEITELIDERALVDRRHVIVCSNDALCRIVRHLDAFEVLWLYPREGTREALAPVLAAALLEVPARFPGEGDTWIRATFDGLPQGDESDKPDAQTVRNLCLAWQEVFTKAKVYPQRGVWYIGSTLDQALAVAKRLGG